MLANTPTARSKPPKPSLSDVVELQPPESLVAQGFTGTALLHRTEHAEAIKELIRRGYTRVEREP